MRGTVAAVLALLIATPAVPADDLPDEWEVAGPPTDNDADSEELARVLLREAAALRANPIDLNTADVAQLLRLPIDVGIVLRIVAARDERGPFLSLDDLASAGIPVGVVEGLRPYVTVGKPREVGGELAAVPEEPRGIAWSVRARSWCRSDDAEESWAEDLGSPLSLAGSYARIRAAVGEDLRLGIGLERDPGEASPVDHAALFFEWRVDSFNRGAADVLDRSYRVGFLAGNLSARWAQGLLLGASVFPSETSYPRRRDRARGYDGASESARRGALIALSRGRATVQILALRTQLDAALENGAATTVRESGLHRTEGERAGAGVLVERVVGARVRVRPAGALEVGASWLRFAYDPSLACGDPLRQRFAFSGRGVTDAAGDARLSWGAVVGGLEAAQSSNGGRALLAAVRMSADRARVRFGFARISKEYCAPLGAGAPHCSSGRNATVGWMTAEYRPSTRWSASLGGFVRGRPWRTYHLEMPPFSWELRAAWDCALGAGWRLRLSRDFRIESDEQEEPPGTVLCRRVRTRVALRSRGSCPISISVSTADARVGGAASGDGIGVAASVTTDVGARAAVTLGLAVSAASGSAPTVGHYEPGLPGEFGPRSLNGSGTRWYIRGQKALCGDAVLTARLAGGPERGRLEFGVGLDLTR